MGDSSSKPHTEQPMSPIHIFPIEDMYTPEFSDSFQHTDSFQETAREDSPVEVADPPPKSKLTRVHQKRTYQNEDAPYTWRANKDVRSSNVQYGEHEMKDGALERGSVLWSVRCLKWTETKVPKFLAKSVEGSGKRYKTSGSSSFNTESGEASINLNVDVSDDEEDEVQEIRRPIGRDKAKGSMKNKGQRASGSSSTNDDALARLM
ncbi:hypothetical protein Tco_0163438 [Tanacetum coccineum]